MQSPTNLINYKQSPCVPLLQDGSELEIADMDGQELEGLLRTCPLMPASHLDWLHKIPVLAVLSLNGLFLARIMWVS